ncbi:41502_t:CDS:2, partial [Gigaspora margarita]
MDSIQKYQRNPKTKQGWFGTVYGAKWIYGHYCGWNIEKKILTRYGWQPVAFKFLSDPNQKHSEKVKEFLGAKIEQSITTHASDFWPYCNVESWTMLKD